MKDLFADHKFLFNYILLVLIGLILYSLSLILSHSSSFFFLAASLYLITLPGYLIWRIIRIPAQGIMRLLIFFGLGLAFYLIANLKAIFFGINIDQLIKIYVIILPLLFIVALVSDFLKPFKQEAIFDWKKIWQKENIVYLVPIVLSIFIFLVIEAKGADFNGDPYYHLAILRKVVEGSKLNPASLVFSQTGSVNPAYAYPAWHIFVAGMSKILDVDIFTAWSKMVLPILVFTFLAWWQLSKAIFGKKNYAALGFIFFLASTFFSNVGYLFQRLTVPDTLTQYFLMPLALVLFLENIFSEKIDYKKLSVFSLAMISLLIVHGIHYFYVLLAAILFVIIYIVVERKRYRVALLTLIWALAPLLFIALILEVKGGFISGTLRHFEGSENIDIAYFQFASMGLVFQYAFLLTPLLLLFIKKEKRLILLLALMVLTPLIYWTPLKDLFSRILSFVFTDRLMGNVALYYFVFALIAGFFIVLFENAVVAVSRIEKYIIQGLLGTILLVMILLECYDHTVSNLFDTIFYSQNISNFLTENVWYILALIIIIVIGLLWWQVAKKRNIFELGEFQSGINGLILSFIFVFMLMSPTLRQSFNLISPGAQVDKPDYRERIISYETLGGETPVAFIRGNVPAKSVILADDETAKGLSMLTNNYMAYNLSSSAEQELMTVFDDNNAADSKTNLIKSPIYQIDYIYLRPAYLTSAAYFESRPNFYQEVYSGDAKIFKVIK